MSLVLVMRLSSCALLATDDRKGQETVTSALDILLALGIIKLYHHKQQQIGLSQLKLDLVSLNFLFDFCDAIEL